MRVEDRCHRVTAFCVRQVEALCRLEYEARTSDGHDPVPCIVELEPIADGTRVRMSFGSFVRGVLPGFLVATLTTTFRPLVGIRPRDTAGALRRLIRSRLSEGTGIKVDRTVSSVTRRSPRGL